MSGTVILGYSEIPQHVNIQFFTIGSSKALYRFFNSIVIKRITLLDSICHLFPNNGLQLALHNLLFQYHSRPLNQIIFINISANS